MTEQIVRELVNGEWVTTYAQVGGGGSQPGALACKEFLVTEVATADQVSFPITAVDDGTGEITIAGSHAAAFPVNLTFVVAGSTGNDGSYQVESVAEAGGNTTVTVTAESLADATADGVIQYGLYGPVTWEIPAGARILDVHAYQNRAWAASVSTGGTFVIVRDSVNDYFGISDAVGDYPGVDYDPTALIPGYGWSTPAVGQVSLYAFNDANHRGAVNLTVNGTGATAHSEAGLPPGVPYPDGDTLTVLAYTWRLAADSPVVPTGITLVRVYYTTAVTATDVPAA